MNTSRIYLWMILCAVVATTSSIPRPLHACTYDLVNGSFEDVSGQTVFNEFTFGVPVGWQLYDPGNVASDAGTFVGTLSPNGVEFFNSTAPDGDRVAILFNSGREGEGEYGLSQTLSDTLQANTRYSLSVEIGNIASGTATNGTFFNLDEFPGYRVELRAGGVLLAEDSNSLTIPEGEFAQAMLNFTVGSDHAQLGEQIEVRLVNLNQIPDGYDQSNSPDLEVDFDNVRFSATAVPEANSTALLLAGCVVIFSWQGWKVRNRQKMPIGT